ncbi:MAG: isochorismatase family cysteine hydrolase [Candidatus Moranbacteria bacterium]|nr:isochorismatase family cysteine hydrolase [Candidatus Moranbacteria bacterium]
MKKSELKINYKNTALLIIDMQNDFIEKDAIIEVPGIRKNLLKYARFIDECRNKGISIIYTKHIFSPRNNPIEARLFPELSKNGLRKNTHGSDIVTELYPKGNDVIIEKNRYDAFYGTNLDNVLKDKKIKNIIISGTMTNICCDSTMRSAMYRDYNILFLSDLNYAFDKKVHDSTLKTVETNFGLVVSSKQFSF